MSLVAYGSSDESSDEEVKPVRNDPQSSVKNKIENGSIDSKEQNFSANMKNSTNLTVSGSKETPEKFLEEISTGGDDATKNKFLAFSALPKPKHFQHTDIPEEDDLALFETKLPTVEKPVKKHNPPARISIPSLSEFRDVDEDLEQSRNKPTASKGGIGLFSILPPPRNEIAIRDTKLVPRAVTKSVSDKIEPKKIVTGKPLISKAVVKETKKNLPLMEYDSNSEDEDEQHQDFFSLSKTTVTTNLAESTPVNYFTIPEKQKLENLVEDSIMDDEEIRDVRTSDTMEIDSGLNSTLVSTVMNLPRDEILLKNKAEVGPKLPVPEQEFNVDSEGNVAFDEKAIEYLCGKRGVKRKNEMIQEANIIEINGEDIKPDEREWLVKALTEEPVQRPVSMQGAGPSSQSKKKHQITYLAHQAKAMEVELKNTWSQNRMAKKQTQSKYGF